MLKNVINGLAMVAFLAGSNYAMEDDLAREIEQIEWNCQVENVKDYLKTQDKHFLVLGVDTQESDYGFPLKSMERFTAEYVFLDKYSKPDHLRNRDLKVDFNDLEQLKRLATDFSGYFDSIILDDSTFKFTEWTKDHLGQFKAMLKDGGMFVFAPGYGMINYIGGAEFRQLEEHQRKERILNITEAELEKVASESSKLSGEMLCKFIEVPFAYGHSIDERTGRIFQNSEKPGAFAERFLHSRILTDNYIPIVEGVFGKDNVIVEFDQKLPFPGRYSSTQKILMTAIKL